MNRPRPRSSGQSFFHRTDLLLGLTISVLTLATDWDRFRRAPGFKHFAVPVLTFFALVFVIRFVRRSSAGGRRQAVAAGLVLGLVVILAPMAIFFFSRNQHSGPKLVVADITRVDGSDPYDVTEIVIARTREEVQRYTEDLEVEALGRAIGRHNPNDEAARAGAAFIIWGQYRTTPTRLVLDVHCGGRGTSNSRTRHWMNINIPIVLPRRKDNHDAVQAAIGRNVAKVAKLFASLAYIDRRQFARADELLADAMNGMDDPEFRALVSYYRGMNATLLGTWEPAIAYFTDAINLGDHGDETYGGRGRCYFFNSQYELALADFNTALQQNPYPEWFCMRGLTYSVLGDRVRGEADLSRGLARAPKVIGDSVFRSTRMHLAIDLEHFRTAESDYRILSDLLPRERSKGLSVLLKSAEPKLAAGLKKRAVVLSAASAAIERAPTPAARCEALERRGALLAHYGEYDAAASDIRSALAIAGADPMSERLRASINEITALQVASR